MWAPFTIFLGLFTDPSCQDPLLYNRLGATLANSGKTDEAIRYYHEALEIQPAYVRARFNLAVANMNLGVSPLRAFQRAEADRSFPTSNTSLQWSTS